MENPVKDIDNSKLTNANRSTAADTPAGKLVNLQEKSPEIALENAAEPEKKKKRTFGNKVYDFLVFAPIAWGGVWVASATTGYQAIHGTSKNFVWLRDMNNAVGKQIKNVLSKYVMKKSAVHKPENVDSMARNIGLVFILGMGSHPLMAPIKWLEDHRQSNAAKIDKFFGTTPPDAETIKDEPKQSWGSVFSGRMASWATAFIALGSMGPKLMKWNDDFGAWAAKKWTGMGFHKNTHPQTVRNWANLLAFDALGTAVTAAVTYVFSRFVAASFGRKEIADTVYELNPAAPNPLGEDESPHKKAPQKTSQHFTKKVQAENKAKTPAEPNVSYVNKITSEAGTSHSLA